MKKKYLGFIPLILVTIWAFVPWEMEDTLVNFFRLLIRVGLVFTSVIVGTFWAIS